MATTRENLDFQAVSFTATNVAAVALLAANREYLLIQNQSDLSGQDVWVRCDGIPATPDNNSTHLPPRTAWEPVTPPAGPVSVITLAGTAPLHIVWG